MQTHRIAGGGGVGLHVVEHGRPDGPSLLFVHGYCQSTYAWRHQFAGELARDFRLVAFDLRGHGLSDKPEDPGAYTDGGAWADDVAAIVKTLDLRHTILIGWSYGGYVVGDYLRVHGQGRIAGLNLVDTASIRGSEEARPLVGDRYVALFPALFSNEASTLVPALAAFADLCVAHPLEDAERFASIGAAALCPAVAREAMQRGRRVNNNGVFAAVSVPVLVTHGARDAVLLQTAGERTAQLIRGAELSIYPEAGHSPFAEDPARFDRELRALAERTA